MGERLKAVSSEEGRRRKELFMLLGERSLLMDEEGLQELTDKIISFMGGEQYLARRNGSFDGQFVEIYAKIRGGNLLVNVYDHKVEICYADGIGDTKFSSRSPISGVEEMGQLGDRSLLLHLKNGGYVGVEKEFAGVTIRPSRYSGPRD